MISGLKLLIADDSATIQKVVELTFLDEGMEVASAVDGNQAIDKLEEFAPDVVLADVFMPGRTGYEVCEAIKHHERFHHIPVMLLVGSFEPFDEAEARRVGADDVLTKPFQSIRQLVNRVGTLLGGRPAEKEATTQRLSALGLETKPEVAGEAEPRADLAGPGDQGPTSHDADRELMSTAEIELTTADTKPLEDSRPDQPAAFASDELMARPLTEPIVDMAEPFAADVRGASDRTALAERLTSNSEPATPGRETETPLPIEPMDYRTEHVRTTGVDEIDGLLDLGDLDAPPVQPAYEDSILELEDETFAPPATADSQPPAAEPETGGYTAAPAAGYYESEFESGWSDSSKLTPAEKHAAIEQEADNREQIDVAQWEIVPSLVTVDAKLDEPASTEAAPQSSMGPEDAVELSAQPAAYESSGQQLSAADIDAIARRVVEHMSEKVVREIAWEVVPELAELLIKRRMDEQR